MSRQLDNSGKDTVVVVGKVLHETEKAMLVQSELSKKWVPMSQLHQPLVATDEEVEEFYFFIPKWLADKNGFNWDEYDPEEWEKSATPESVQEPYNNTALDDDEVPF